MKKRYVKSLLMCAGCLIAVCCYGITDLSAVYNDALKNDPVFKQAEAQFLADKEAAPQSLSVLLPQIGFSAAGGVGKTFNSGSFYVTEDNTRQKSTNYALTLSQSVFNYNYWKTLAASKDSVKAANATYNAAAQNLIGRVARAYFNVLIAEAALNTTAAKKRAVYKQYVFAKQSFDVGEQTMTDVYSAQASYDSAVAEYISNQNDLDARKEDLRAITNKNYKGLMALGDRIILKKPLPNKIDKWVDNAIKNNWQLQAARFTTLAAKQTLSAAKANHYPTVSLSAEYDNNYTDQFSSSTNGRQTNYMANLSVNLPIFQGGLVLSQVRQAAANYSKQINIEDQDYRSVTKLTRQYYLAIIADVSKIRADRQSVVSNRSSLKGIIEGYKVGARSILDVLNTETSLYTAIRNYLTDRYSYILDTVLLKEAAGTLSVEDIKNINQWLQIPLEKNKKANADIKRESKKNGKKGVLKSINTSVKSFTTKKPIIESKSNLKKSEPVVKSAVKKENIVTKKAKKNDEAISNLEERKFKKNVYLQMAAFQKEKTALDFIAMLGKKNIKAKLSIGVKNGANVYRVQAGPFDRAEANKITAQYNIGNKKIKPFITKDF